MFTRNDIRKFCTPAPYQRGVKLWKAQGILSIDLTETHIEDCFSLKATVSGSNNNHYFVTASIDELEGDVYEHTCTCLAHGEYNGLCKHVIAACLEFIDQLPTLKAGIKVSPSAPFDKSTPPPAHVTVQTSSSIKKMMETYASREGMSFASTSATAARNQVVFPQNLYHQVDIEPTLTYDSYSDWNLKLKIGVAQMYVVKSIDDLIAAIQDNTYICYGKKLSFNHEREAFTPRALALIDFLQDIQQTRTAVLAQYSAWHISQQLGKTLALTPRDLMGFFDLYAGESCDYEREGLGCRRMDVIDGNPELELALTSADDGSFNLTMGGIWGYLASNNHLYLRQGNRVFRCTPAFRHELLPFFESITATRNEAEQENRRRSIPKRYGNTHGAYSGYRYSEMYNTNYGYDEPSPFETFNSEDFESGYGSQVETEGVSLPIAQRDMPSFCATVLPALQNEGIRDTLALSIPESIQALLPEPGVFEFRLDKRKKMITCEASVAYGSKQFNVFTPIDSTQLFRDIKAEQRVRNVLAAYFDQTLPNRAGVYLPDSNNDKIFNLLDNGMDQLKELGDLLASDAFKHLSIRKAANTSVGLSVKGNLLDIQVSAEGVSAAELQSYLAGYRQRRSYIRLNNNTFIRLEDSGLDVANDLIGRLHLTHKQLASGEARIPLYNALQLDDFLEDRPDTIFDQDGTFKRLIKEFSTITCDEFTIPPSLVSVLRPYQATGYQWLKTLERFGFGGILADEMGLGKTVQMIAFLVAHHCEEPQEGERLPSLIICPASLIYNWEQEIARFAPQLSTLVVAGNKAERDAIIASVAHHDVIITSYDLLRRDQEAYEAIPFYVEILDEAQYIKNQNTLNARAVKSIDSSLRFALTGTPIENRLSEIWSIFDFLMPGLLGPYKTFRDTYEQPIIATKNEEATARFQHIIKPFVMRRLKTNVLKDLPDKTESIMISPMEEEQSRLYRASALRLKLMLDAQSSDTFKTEKLAVLAELMKLRQICCDPSLLFDNYEGGSAKLETCLELIEEARAGGHKMLVFSQFTSMLAIIEKRLNAQGIDYHLLTGSTPKKKRAELVTSFDTDDTPVFLISLKAGGSGLNLTAADIVIHYDPWWNLAVQNQATDRTHRIGQEKIVTVFKLIAKDTIEEAIVKLQDTKHDLAEKILGEEGVSVAALTKTDLMELLETQAF